MTSIAKLVDGQFESHLENLLKYRHYNVNTIQNKNYNTSKISKKEATLAFGVKFLNNISDGKSSSV